MLERIRGGLAGASRELGRADVLDLVPWLTLIMVILLGGDFWSMPVPLRLLAIAALFYRPLYRSGVFWLALTACLLLVHVEGWYEIDNHKYLMTYWTLALGVVFLLRGEERQRRVLARNAKLLIGLCMAFAVLWKAISPDYLDGSFFRHALLTDARFHDLTTSVGGLGPDDGYRNRALVKSLTEGTRNERYVTEVELVDTPRIALLADVMTWWTIGIELLLAVAFLLPDRGPPALRWRHALLLFFAVTTYAIAVVIGFGWLLLIMALAHLPPDRQRLRLAYLAVLLLLVSYPDGWAGGLISWLAAQLA